MGELVHAILITCAVGCQVVPGTTVDEQAVAGPIIIAASSTVVGQIDVTWTVLSPAFKYYVFQSSSGPTGPFVFLASVLPPASLAYTSTGLIAGTSYCYQIVGAFPDGSSSDPSAAKCAVANGVPTVVTQRQVISAFGAVAGNAAIPGAVMVNGVWFFRNPRQFVNFKISLNTGFIIDSFMVWANKQSGINTDLNAQLVDIAPDGSQSVIGGTANVAPAPGPIILRGSAFGALAGPDHSYAIRMVEGLDAGSVVGMDDTFTNAEITYH